MRIHGAGCCLIDTIYGECDYTSEAFKQLWSRTRGDGGLIEGGLVFTEDLERFSGLDHRAIIERLTGGRPADAINIGGPAVVALIHSAQILACEGTIVEFFGATGDDENGALIRRLLEKTPLIDHLTTVADRPTPTTEVFNDPTQQGGKGERSFLNTIGAAWEIKAEDLGPHFYDAEIILLGGTALVPHLHDDLHQVLKRAKENGCITVVGTVFDFRNERLAPQRRWPLGHDDSYQYIDVLVSDEEEALRLTGTQTVRAAAESLRSSGVGAFIITRGAEAMYVWSSGHLVAPSPLTTMPVSAYFDELLRDDPSLRRDTTGCGDNFLGGILVALVKAKGREATMLDLCAWGAASGGLALTYSGGTYHESAPSEKAALLAPAITAYYERGGER